MILELGRTLAAPGALRALEEEGETPDQFFARHEAGDWGTVGPEDSEENQLSVREGFRVLSAYTLATGVKLWVITEADRSATTILLPDEY